MNYQVLTNIVESIIWNFRCPECWHEAHREDLEILWTAWWSLNAEINCKKCGKHSFLRAEFNTMPIVNLWTIPKEQIENIKNKIAEEKSKNKINEKEILDLRNTLNSSENINISDFLN